MIYRKISLEVNTYTDSSGGFILFGFDTDREKIGTNLMRTFLVQR